MAFDEYTWILFADINERSLDGLLGSSSLIEFVLGVRRIERR